MSVALIPGVPRCSPYDLARLWHGPFAEQHGKFPQIVRDHDLSEAPGDGHDFWPGRCLEILRVGVVGRLGRRGVKRDTELSHQNDLFVTSKAYAEVPLWLVGVTEVVEECVKDMVQVFERRRVKPHVPLPWWIGQSQHSGYDVDSVVRYESRGFAHKSERSDRS
ncbi:hypothetical protein ACFZA1_02935 [Streptomyces filipinensis]|uniref:hypothetical protein n=1 Tax=Streptomyces filipinensis TaxID=66887 RepID=UPI0036EECDE5